MKRLLDLFFCIIKSKKISSIKKKKFIIFDCSNADIILKILPSDKTFLLSSRHNRISELLINFQTISFLIKKIFLRSLQLNYFISLINQIEPEYVITNIDNSITFSKLTKYFENKIKFIAIQNATRGEFYENNSNENSKYYFTNYMGMSNFDYELMKRKNIKVKNFYAIGSLRNSYFKKFIYPKKNNSEKSYDICLVGKNIFKGGVPTNSFYSDAIFKMIEFLAKYLRHNDKSLIIQSKSRSNNVIEKNFYEEKLKNTNYKISWKDHGNYNSYESISSSRLIIGVPSTLLREALVYPNVKVICFNSEKKENKYPFPENNFINQMTYEEFEDKLNQVFDKKQNSFSNITNNDFEYVMKKTDSINDFLNILEKGKKELI